MGLGIGRERTCTCLFWDVEMLWELEVVLVLNEMFVIATCVLRQPARSCRENRLDRSGLDELRTRC